MSEKPDDRRVRRMPGDAAEMNRQERNRNQHQGDMNEDLVSNAFQLSKKMSVDIADQQHRLEKQHAGGPNRSGAAEYRQHHLADHGFTTEEQKSADKQRHAEKRQHT